MEKIEEINDSHEKLMDQIADEYERIVLSGYDFYDVDKIVAGIDFLYTLTDLKAPQIVICESPLDMKIQAGLKKGETYDALGAGYDSGWTAFYDFMNQIGVQFEKEFQFEEWKNFVKKSGVFASILFQNVAFVCPRPYEVHRNKDFNLHNENGMAIAWRDGYGEYVLNGIIVEEEIVMTPAEKLDSRLVLREKNVEVRREIVRKIGIEKVCKDLKAEVIDSFGDYEVLNLNLGDGRIRPYLKMVNPSTETYHIEGIEPKIKTVKEALVWRNALKEYEDPRILS